MSKQDHTHKYYRVLVGSRKIVIKNGKRYLEKGDGREVFKCAVPGCPTFKLKELAIGDKSICWTCGEELILNTENTRLKKPTHITCRRMRDKIA